MPERRGGFGRRTGEERGERRVSSDPPKAGGKREGDPPAAPEPSRPEVEPNRRHFLHRQIGKKKKKAA